MGSGKVLVRALRKYGSENFEKIILHVYSTAEEMWTKERELVYVSEETYNLKEGGTGGWDYVNMNSCKLTDNVVRQKSISPFGKKEFYEFHREVFRLAGNTVKELKIGIHDPSKRGSFKGKTHAHESKEKIGKANSIHQKGNGNSQYGTCWVTNGIENKKIQKSELDKWISLGFHKGRITCISLIG